MNDEREWVAAQLLAAQALQERRIMPLPVPFGKKNPNRPGWENERHNGDNRGFRKERVNIGMRLGHIVDDAGHVLTDKFLDVDLDCPEAVAVAPYFLPPTGMIWGRNSNPRSHYGYRLTSLEGARTVQTFADPLRRGRGTGEKRDAGIVEIRFSGHTLAPGSVNAEGECEEPVRWELDGNGDPGELDFAVILAAVARLYAAALIARYWDEGIRHNATLPLAGMLSRGEMLRADARTFVKAVCAASGDPQVDDRLRAIESTYDRAERGEHYTGMPTLEEFIDPKIVVIVKKQLGLKKGTGGDIGPDGYPLSDIGNAERFVVKWGGQVVYCDDQGQWWLYGGRWWEQDRRNALYPMAMQVVNDFRARVADKSLPNQGNTTPDQWDRHVREWSKTKNIRAMLELVRGLVPVVPEEFDTGDNLLNCLDGTIVLNTATGEHHLRAHSADDLITKHWNAHYVPDATHPDVDEYRGTFLPEGDRWGFIEEAVAYSLTGGPKRYNIQLLGPSNAGKSMLLRILSEQGGTYAQALKYQSLKADERGGDRPRSDLTSVRGSRIVTITEVPQGASWDTDLFNTMLSGGDVYAARGAYERRVQHFAFTATLWTSGNKPYGARGDNDAAYQRIHVVKFDHQMPLDKRRDTREAEIVDAARTGDAFLACWLRGFARLYGEKGGRLTPPDSVRAATEAVRRELDPIEKMVDELVRVTGVPSDRVLKSDLNALASQQASEKRMKWGYDRQRATSIRC
jgi:putative DNA primase/helicase